MDLEKIQFSDRFFRWGLSIALAMVVIAFMLAVNTPAGNEQPCVDYSARAQIFQTEIRIHE